MITLPASRGPITAPFFPKVTSVLTPAANTFTPFCMVLSPTETSRVLQLVSFTSLSIYRCLCSSLFPNESAEERRPRPSPPSAARPPTALSRWGPRAPLSWGPAHSGRNRGLPSGGPGITLAAVTFRALIPLGCGWRWSGSMRPSSFLI